MVFRLVRLENAIQVREPKQIEKEKRNETREGNKGTSAFLQQKKIEREKKNTSPFHGKNGDRSPSAAAAALAADAAPLAAAM